MAVSGIGIYPRPVEMTGEFWLEASHSPYDPNRPLYMHPARENAKKGYENAEAFPPLINNYLREKDKKLNKETPFEMLWELTQPPHSMVPYSAMPYLAHAKAIEIPNVFDSLEGLQIGQVEQALPETLLPEQPLTMKRKAEPIIYFITPDSI